MLRAVVAWIFAIALVGERVIINFSVFTADAHQTSGVASSGERKGKEHKRTFCRFRLQWPHGLVFLFFAAALRALSGVSMTSDFGEGIALQSSA